MQHEGKHQALRGVIIELTLVKQRLNKTKRRPVVQVIEKLHLTAERFRDPFVERFQRGSVRFCPEQRFQRSDGLSHGKHLGAFTKRALLEFSHLINSFVFVIDEVRRASLDS